MQISGDSSSPPWHALPLDRVFDLLESDGKGLSEPDSLKRRAVYGANILPAPPKRGAWRRLVAQFHNLLIYILLVSALLSASMGYLTDASVILAVVAVNAAIGFLQEGRAEQALDAIRAMIDPKASVLRDGKRYNIAVEELVPGDVVLIEAGDRIPADLRLIRARMLQIDEAALTGESNAVDKSPEPVADNTLLGERASMAYRGTLARAGHGMGLVVATGAHTQIGRISSLVGAIHKEETPLIRQINRFARSLTFVILAIAAAVFLFAHFIRDYDLEHALMVVVGLAVAAIPEGLPAIISITMAIGVQRMAKRNAIVRHLPAVETLGSVSVICSDKTGTLTRNEMMVASLATLQIQIEIGGDGYRPQGDFSALGRPIGDEDRALAAEIGRAALLCNDARLIHHDGEWVTSGDPMEGALLCFAVKAGQDIDAERKAWPRLDEIPFDAQHRLMATLHRDPSGKAVIFLKGAPERVLDLCASQKEGLDFFPIDRQAWHRRIESMAAQGQRVLAFASKAVEEDKTHLTFADCTSGATFLGLLGLIDPPRDEALAAIAECRNAGIRVIMITGDHAATAGAIGHKLGLSATATAMTGQEIDNLDESGLKRAAETISIFARTTPEHKLRLVKALQEQNAIVAMTGDGVNDAPALKCADIGIAMGRKGTEAAKEAAEMVLADDNFASIAAAVREGRTVYDNLMKVIAWTLPTHGGEALTIILAILFGLALPITPVQILWINMITAIGLGLTLSFEPTEPGTMRKPPRPRDHPILTGFLLWRILFVSGLFVLGGFGVFFWALQRGLSLDMARTMVVNALVVLEICYLFSVRHSHETAWRWQNIIGTKAIIFGVITVAIGQAAFTYLPALQKIFQTQAMAAQDVAAILGVGVIFLAIVEIENALRRALIAFQKRTLAN